MKSLWLSALVIGLDQFTKWLANSSLVPHDPVAVLPGFNLTLMFNTGAAFSLLGDAGGWQRWLFTGLAVVASVVLVLWLRRLQAGQALLAVALALILGGAVGNLIDRVVFGHVIDFLDVYWRHHHWPAFNVADSAITVGALLFLLDSFRPRPADGA